MRQVIIYSGKEYYVIDETPETFAVQDENGDFHVIPKTAAVEKYGTIKSAVPWGLIVKSAVPWGLIATAALAWWIF